MVIKTFNLEEEVYKKFSDFCKENGLSMSKQVNIFIKAQIEVKPKVREEYLAKLDNIRKGRFIKVGSIEDFKKRYA
jgi:antitoxin component of RelBE/YafQ-DinJ toxin-antitoxin module